MARRILHLTLRRNLLMANGLHAWPHCSLLAPRRRNENDWNRSFCVPNELCVDPHIYTQQTSFAILPLSKQLLFDHNFCDRFVVTCTAANSMCWLVQTASAAAPHIQWPVSIFQSPLTHRQIYTIYICDTMLFGTHTVLHYVSFFRRCF